MAFQIKSILGTAGGAVVGAVAGGPLGFVGGLVLGAGIDYLRRKQMGASPVSAGGFNAVGVPAAVAAGIQTPGQGGLPAGADTAAAASAVRLMLLGKPAEIAPARSWLTAFQASVGLPGTGRMDPTTRAMLVLATPLANNLPNPTILG